MTEIRAAFPEIDTLEPFELETLQREILHGANGDWKALDDESLTRLWKITRALRKKAAHSGERRGRNGTSPAAKKKQADLPDADDLA